MLTGGFSTMLVRPAQKNDTPKIIDILKEAYTTARYDAKFIPYWIECFVSNSLVFPSYVVESEEEIVLGYIVWRVRQLSANHNMTLELQELAARKGSDKVAVEELLINESPSLVVTYLETKGFSVREKCYLDIWVHSDDRYNNKSVVHNISEEGKFLGGFEKRDARGEILLLYRKKYRPKGIESEANRIL